MAISNQVSSVWLGIGLVAGGTVGAGMLALPMVSAGMWFWIAFACLFFVWAMNYLANLCLLEVALKYPPGASFHTIVKSELGESWAQVNNLGVLFIMYILLYAYFSAGSSMMGKLLDAYDLSLDQGLAGTFLGLLIALLICVSANWVGRMCTILLLAMFISFSMGSLELLPLATSLNLNLFEVSWLNYIWSAVPAFVAAFACGGIVPSLVKLYGADAGLSRDSLKYGTLIALFMYVVWLLCCYSALSRADMQVVIEQGGNVSQLLDGFQANGSNLSSWLNLFSNFAILTSFLSIGLGLFDFLQDRLSLGKYPYSRVLSCAIAFLPPAILSLIFPNGFVLAIGFAGLAVVFCFYFIPALMMIKNDDMINNHVLASAMTRRIIALILTFSVIALLTKLSSLFGWSPTFPH